MAEVIVLSIQKSHLRIDIAGGTLDLWPLYHFTEGAVTINAAISLAAQADVSFQDTAEIEISITNLNYTKKFKDFKQLKLNEDKELGLLRPLFNVYEFSKLKGFKVKTQSESPVGGGLGGSSTLLIALLKAFDEELEFQREEEEYVTLACGLESKILESPAGTQDYYQAIQPGLSKISYNFHGRQRTFFQSPWLEKHKKDFVLIDSGEQHHSGLNNWKIFQNAVNKDATTLKVLTGLKEISEGIYTELQSLRASHMPTLLAEELRLRTLLATGYVSPSLQACIEVLQNHDVQNFKICGAGGGGCIWAIVPPEQRSQLQFGTSARLIPCELVL